MQLMISSEALRTMQGDAVEAYPHECCGFMFGPEDDPREITMAKPAKNIREENRKRRFEIDASDYMAAEKFADENQLLLLGVYHSHPDHPAIPSEYDLRVSEACRES
jgi:proteasome lid subunit RPN8/RPN11